MIRLALIGFGTVNGAVYDLLQARKSIIERALGQPYEIVKILVRSLDRPGRDRPLFTDQVEEWLAARPDVVLEATGQGDGMAALLSRLLASGCHVISANKALLACHLPTLLASAKRGGSKLRYEAAVGGALPVMEDVDRFRLINDHIHVRGILNGTCNFILSQMQAGDPFPKALKAAQEQGFAEADPSDDIEGWDSRRKLCLLASRLFSVKLSEADIACEGICQVTPDQLAELAMRGKTLKLLAEAYQDETGQIHAWVRPQEVDAASFFGQVQGAENIIELRGETTGPLRYFGLGAGGGPTASAMVSDFLAVYGD